MEEIIIFHAGSLSVPLRDIKTAYEIKNPSVKILLEPSGSLVCARKISELKKPCDIIASADYLVINELLIPDFAQFNIRFATNEMVIAYHEKSKYSSQINSDNWIELLSRDDVIYSRSDPNADPGGYRTVLLLMLAEKHYGIKGLTDKFLSKNTEFIRPKEVDLIALIESNVIDYMFQYKSVAEQHGFKYIGLPSEINLSHPEMDDQYNSVSVDVTGSKPGSKINIEGESISYGISIPDNAPNREKAIDLICFILSDEGLKIFRRNGQKTIAPFSSGPPDKIPSVIQKYLHYHKTNL